MIYYNKRDVTKIGERRTAIQRPKLNMYQRPSEGHSVGCRRRAVVDWPDDTTIEEMLLK